MPLSQPSTTEVNVTPRQYLEFIKLGTGTSLDQQAYEDFEQKNGTEIAEQTRRLIEELTGLEPKELQRAAPGNTFLSYGQSDHVKKGIRERILSNLAFVQKFADKRKEKELRRMGVEANKYINRSIDYYFSGEEEIGINSEVETCNDAATLALMAFNDECEPILKFEAARKLFLMKFFGEIEDYNKQEEDNEEALQYMMGIFNSRILELPPGSKIGATFPRYLVSEHDAESFKTKETAILEDRPIVTDTEKVTKVTKMKARKTTVENEEGEAREIFFTIEPREKEIESRLTKTLRYGCKVGEKDVDRNGLRLVFEKREDWDDFFQTFKAEIEREIIDELCKNVTDDLSEAEMIDMVRRMDKPDGNIEIYELQDSLGSNEFNGHSSSSSKDFKVFKFKMRVTRGDGRQHQYEFQVFLPDGYADAKYRKGVSWEEYHARKFFSEGVDELLFPESIYPDLDRKRAHEKVMARIHRKVWNGKSSD